MVSETQPLRAATPRSKAGPAPASVRAWRLRWHLGLLIAITALPLLASRSYLMHQPTGRGHVIAFAEDPNYRAYAEATELLFVNAVLLGIAH